ncbi:hypothetical protein I204_06550 [Kwoniella mangroviensis CBS 8886]|uniref:uncharacterized protein n=1 Tax=Kwoniella mangroviensis CBS 8507 TaxID=1296122 RepID=UPI00080D0E1B|nr:uncharacterized protein I203_03558 [Kwoniella mangroviensis CBS 8507]OCF66877.1 hypothetical protein I203_03558 [Kwoniella mangroviensis CBS 8507]OCF73319.1 hypothetical protein I204_06550 [Kwoniella mangroviensis CBS 8886]
MSPTKPLTSTRPRRSLPTPVNSRTKTIRKAQDSGTDTENENEAGPSSIGKDVKGKGKEKEKVPERRVLPARIRRSAGGGEGMREVEEMIIDWLERWGEPSTTPPKQLPIHLTSLPLTYVSPPTTKTQQDVNVPTITLTPSRRKAQEGEGRLGKEEKIEVPDWVMVKAGEDDKEEAREELVFGLGGKGKGPVSPVKRLRRGGIGDEVEEDTSDSYYLSLHRKYEVFERRQRIREKEKLQFERYKMKSRLDLLKNIPRLNWILIVNTILQRFTNQNQPTPSKADEELDTIGEIKKEDGISRAKAKIRDNGEEWLKDLLIREGEQLMKRFHELLPPEPRKPKHSSANTPHQPSSRLSTPSRASHSLSPSLTPPPVVLPARVAALRDPPSTVSSTNKRKRRSTIASTSTTTTTADHPAGEEKTPSQGERRSTRVIKTYGKRSNSGNIDKSSPSNAMMIDSSDGESESEEEEPYSPSQITIPSASKTRKATTSVATMATGINTQTSLPSKPNSKAINHTQQSIKSFFKPPPPPHQNQNQPLMIVRPLAPKPYFATTPATTSKTNSTIVSSLTTSSPGSSTSIRNANNVPAKSAITTPAQRPSSYPIRVPCLIEAASRRESGFGLGQQKEAGDPQGLGVEAQNASRERSGSISNKRFDSVNGNRGDATPFGVALPGRLEWKSEFTITDEEDFWPIIAHRQNIRSSINNNNSNNDQRKISNGISHVSLTKDDSVLTPEEVEELEGVEEAVVL